MKPHSVILLIFLIVLSPIRFLAAESDTPKKGEPMDEVRDHLQDAIRSLGKAGRLTYESQLPVLQEKSEEILKETQKLMQELEQRMRKKEEKKPDVKENPAEGISSI
ncbi:MAG: hypothetical protein HQL94_03770 [Magnetococcales bacterium]|nr:hypothetical protein [Magnetococcales bacterium]MBF0438999.1 hypothetical protein [Magnetococcales bacterium]